MAVFASTAKIDGTPLTELIGTDRLSDGGWEAIKGRVKQGGKRIIELRGRSSFQSPAHQSVLMVRSVIKGSVYPWPCGVYVDSPQNGFEKTLMAMETALSKDGVHWSMPAGTEDELYELRASYGHLVTLGDDVIQMGILPPTDEWSRVNRHLA